MPRIAAAVATALLAGSAQANQASSSSGVVAIGATSLDLSFGLPGASLGLTYGLGDSVDAGARVDFDAVLHDERETLYVVGARVPVRLQLASGGSFVVAEVAAGLRRFSGSWSSAGCDCSRPLPATLALQAPLQMTAGFDLGSHSRFSLVAALGADLLLSGGGAGSRLGVLLSPQGGPVFELLPSATTTIGLAARFGRFYLVTSRYDPSLLAGARNAAIPLSLQLTLSFAL
jgi:hypothetical protein